MTAPNTGKAKTNPRISTVEIGIRDLRELKIYPLSIADEINMRDILKEGLSRVTIISDNVSLVGFFIDFVMENMERILSLVISKDENYKDIIAEVDNDQMEEIVTIIYKVNFESLSKKLKGLMEKWFEKEEELPSQESLLDRTIEKTSMRPSESSSEPTPSTT